METTMESMPRKRIAVSLSTELIKWVDSEVKATTFGSRSHAIEHALVKLKESMTMEKERRPE